MRSFSWCSLQKLNQALNSSDKRLSYCFTVPCLNASHKAKCSNNRTRARPYDPPWSIEYAELADASLLFGGKLMAGGCLVVFLILPSLWSLYLRDT